MTPAVDYEKEFTFYTQQTFRRILDAMARPGKVQTMTADQQIVAASLGRQAGYLMGIARTLLDVEVTFCIRAEMEKENGLAELIPLYTNSAAAPAATADFIFMNGADDPAVLKDLYRGSLEFPDRGATVVIAVSYVCSERPYESEGGLTLAISGPGVNGERLLYTGGLRRAQVAALNEVNQEFPLGIDLIIIAGDKLACIPRSSAVVVREDR
jgi:alpha-D-ribose 1-methylphosphonate 5-triphosphate synthase subunit PhnH